MSERRAKAVRMIQVEIRRLQKIANDNKRKDPKRWYNVQSLVDFANRTLKKRHPQARMDELERLAHMLVTAEPLEGEKIFEGEKR